MTILKDVFSELFSMFVSDAWLTVSILALVGLVAFLVDAAHAGATIGGGALLVGSLALVVGSVRHASRRTPTRPKQ